MPETKAQILARLQKEILPLQGYKNVAGSDPVEMGLGAIRYAFPGASFPVGAIHEFLCNSPENLSSTSGFIAGLLSSLMRANGVGLWISPSKTIYVPALKLFGIEPDRIIFIHVQKEKDMLWCIEEALKCEGLTAVVAQLKDLDFTLSRRFQLAVEESRVTGFMIRSRQKHKGATASVTRWKITAVPSITEENLPGVGFPGWNVELQKVRNGKPGSWLVEWNGRRFRQVSSIQTTIQTTKKKTG